jgi:hypothetical protein
MGQVVREIRLLHDARPNAICVVDDELYVADYRYHQIKVLRMDGTFVRGFSQYQPIDLLCLNDKLFILSAGVSGITIRQKNGQLILTIATVGPLKTLCNVITDGTHLFVSDIQSDTIFVFDMTGNLLRTIRCADRKGRFVGLESITIDGDELFALDSKRVQVFRHSDGVLLRSFPHTITITPFNTSMLATHHDHIYLCNGYTVHILNHLGKSIHSFGCTWNPPCHPIYRTVFHDNQFIVCDFYNSRLLFLI